MSDLFAAFGLVLALEGALYALFPDFMKRVAEQAVASPSDMLRTVGLVSAGFGVALVWLARG
ncbi:MULTISPECIES: DUF2065 domain-containing protein [Afifella]|uniref:DUF2065 domain-containing protein n=1 Tax=Afifella marina DSM 2698 TaxID=1120955 RepID=A0A1G5N5J8_AFIMA|nr:MULTISPECIES: DUF2065 domain-containing protein [Afifella]MBK1622446.1 DUF2065 domain-containing protein [Afifella marina DSM 2698]MBK1626840.1 DUF2065 domain-containing protein [Afifella marina]MBK5919230.1 hypothetical protein [Afifella marina]MCF1503408.1 DUF2065 domain-containing protein [Afifella sp. H1R]MCT8267449.1 DUF2065 domain-containing protein [Afifella sp. JA880]